MSNLSWLFFVMIIILLWSATSLLYKVGIHKDKEDHTCLKYTVSVGIVFFAIALVYFLIREEPFAIWESALKFWPMTIFGIIYAIANTVSFNGYVYNEVTVESPVERVSGGVSTIFLIIAFLILGRVEDVPALLTPFKIVGILIIATSVIALSIVRNKEGRNSDAKGPDKKNSSWKWRGLGTLVFPLIFALADGLETVISGVCLDTTYGFSMPEGDAIIIIGMEYAVFALCCWIFILAKEKKVYNPFKKKNAPRILGALTDNVGIVFYSYAMALNSVSTDPLLALYPVVVMLGGRILLKERVSRPQIICLLCIIAGSVMIVLDTMS